MKLTAQQIEKLYAFTKQHYVEYYDLQTELVDHLANGIELQWQENPKLTFREALDIEFKKYGIFGFSDLVEERQKAMSKTYYKLVFRLVKQYFTFPRIMQTLFFILTLYMVLKFIPYKENVVLGLMISVLIFVFYSSFKWRRLISRRKKEKQKIWMYEEIVYSCGSSLGIFQLMIQIPIQILSSHRSSSFLSTETGVIFAAIFVVGFAVFAYVLTIEIPKNAKEYIAKVHPEYKII